MPSMASVAADGTIEEAIMDVTVWWPGSLQWNGVDVTVRYAGAVRYVGAQLNPGKAAVRAEKEKRARYGRDVLPLAMEAGGRMGPGSEASLQRLADAAVAFSGGFLTRRGLLAQWRRRLESSLFFASADAVLCALGRSSKGSAVATRWGSGKPVPAALIDAVDGTPSLAVVPVSAASADSTHFCSDFEDACFDCADGGILEGLEAILAEDEEAAQAMHGHEDVP
jgi:hypothetical protein